MFYHPKSIGFSFGTFLLVIIIEVLASINGIGDLLFILLGLWGFGVLLYNNKHNEEFIKYQIEIYKDFGKDDKYARATVDTYIQLIPVLYVVFSIFTIAGVVSLIKGLF